MRKQRVRKYSKIPEKVMGLGGLINVEVVDELVDESAEMGKKLGGLYDPDTRTIKLLKDSRRQMERMFYHELMHAALDDSGLVNVLSKYEESLADLVAMMMLRLHDGVDTVC